MFIYSNTINSFIKRFLNYTKEIIHIEMGFPVKRNYFLYQGSYIPLNIVIFENKNTLGQFEALTYQIGLNKKLMYLSKSDVIKNIIRHELAHLITYLQFGADVPSHGAEYKQVCSQFNWGSEISNCKVDLDFANDNIEGDLVSENLINKIKKLLALSSSSNVHEANLATLKANQLLLKHNLDKINLCSNKKNSEDEIVYVKRVISTTRNSAKLQAIYDILKTFFVQPVFYTGKGFCNMEVVGSKTNVELADYIANFLNIELESLWKKEQKNNPTLKGITKKNSYMRGIANGQISKINDDRETLMKKSVIPQKSVLNLEHNLQSKLRIVYPRLTQSTRTIAKDCPFSNNIGVKAGKKLSINPAIKDPFANVLSLP